MDDAIRYLVVLLGEDEELYGLAVTVQYHVENVIAYDHLHETENDLVHVMEQEERGTDDEEIAKQKDTSDRYILIFIDYPPIISVPPVLPFAENTSPSPAPHINAPIMIAINDWSCSIGCPFSSHSKREREAESEKTPKIVFIKNFRPRIFKATTNKATLMTK